MRFIRWTWWHTVALFLMGIVLTIIIWLLFGVFIFILLFIPPIIMVTRAFRFKE